MALQILTRTAWTSGIVYSLLREKYERTERIIELQRALYARLMIPGLKIGLPDVLGEQEVRSQATPAQVLRIYLVTVSICSMLVVLLTWRVKFVEHCSRGTVLQLLD